MILACIELIIMLFKAILLSAVYALIIVSILLLLHKAFRFAFLQKMLRYGLPLYILLGFIIFISLFSYRFSYWEDMGMGETVQVPIGYKQYVYNADGFMTYFDSEPDKEAYLQEDLIDIENYIVEGKMICAEIDDESPEPEYKYLVYDMEARALTRFKTKQEYDDYAAAHSCRRVMHLKVSQHITITTIAINPSGKNGFYFNNSHHPNSSRHKT